MSTRPRPGTHDRAKNYSGRKCIPGFTKIFPDFGATVIDRIGFCFSGEFMVMSFSKALHCAKEKINGFGFHANIGTKFSNE